MPAQILSQASSFNSGADLWVIPEKEYSQLARRLDWLLNFQIAKTSKHSAKALPERIEKILNLCELKRLDFNFEDHGCLMIACQNLVPAHWVLVVKDSQQLQRWVQVIYEKWRGLSYPSLRVFLPQGAEATKFESLWISAGGTDQLSLVVDSNG